MKERTTRQRQVRDVIIVVQLAAEGVLVSYESVTTGERRRALRFAAQSSRRSAT